MAKPNLSQPQVMKSLIGDPMYWGLLMDYVAVERGRLVIQLLSCREEELKFIQGQLKSLDNLVNLKAQLKTEESARHR